MKKTASQNKPKLAFNPRDYERTGVSLDEVLEIKEAFDLFDYEKTGSIDSIELKSSLVSFGYQANNYTLLLALSCLSPGLGIQINQLLSTSLSFLSC
jgi:Ca2+-binding EF-hand superfamily protein